MRLDANKKQVNAFVNQLEVGVDVKVVAKNQPRVKLLFQMRINLQRAKKAITKVIIWKRKLKKVIVKRLKLKK